MQLPSWERELLNFKGIKSLFVLEKNIDDLYPVCEEAAEELTPSSARFFDMRQLAKMLFADYEAGGRYQMVCYNPFSRFSDPFHDNRLERYLAAAERAAAQIRIEDERVNAFSAGAGEGAQPKESALVHDSQLIKALLTRNLAIEPAEGEEPMPAQPVAIVVDMASRLLSSPTNLDEEETAFFSNMLMAVTDALRIGESRNTLILLANNLRDLPEWFIATNPNLRAIVVPSPDREARDLYVQHAFEITDTSVDSNGKTVAERFVDVTDGMSIRELDELRRMHGRSSAPDAELCGLVDVYKFGVRENKWRMIADKLERDPEGVIKRRVKGQDQAVSAVISILKRSSLGLSGATHSSSSKPKGILFLSGPTGTGKTEIVKAVTELLFGDERSCIRLDMSEYQGDNSDQKLFGAPPGYVGYAQGGQLTNAVKANPFSVLLFDEIEKANPSIMDKFLQILEDGRMTDGQGNTVYFSETVIFFTSNIGFSQEVFDPSGRHVVDHVALIDPDEPYDAMCAKVKESMDAHFKPEFLGRVGNNVVVFNFIDDKSAAAIVELKIEAVNRNIEKQNGIIVNIDPATVAHFVRRSLLPEIKEKGGRGIGNLIETEYLNVLSDFLFDERCRCGDEVTPEVADGSIRFRREGGDHV